MEKRSPLHLGVVAIEKGTFGSPSTMVDYTYQDYWPEYTNMSQQIKYAHIVPQTSNIYKGNENGKNKVLF